MALWKRYGLFPGNGGQSIVRAWLAFKLTDSEFALGMVMSAVAIPMFFLGPLGGVLADRRDRRNMIVSRQLVVFLVDLCAGCTDCPVFLHCEPGAPKHGRRRQTGHDG